MKFREFVVEVWGIVTGAEDKPELTREETIQIKQLLCRMRENEEQNP